jgi:hypothetical protein
MSMQLQSDRILADATHTGIARGNEWHWKPSDLPAVFQKAKEMNIAAVGGTAEFLFPDATCELYWISVDPKDRGDNETWEEFVTRSNNESLALLATQTRTVDFRREAASWSYVREHTIEKGIDPLDFLVYVFYFNSEEEILELKKWAKDSGLDRRSKNRLKNP